MGAITYWQAEAILLQLLCYPVLATGRYLCAVIRNKVWTSGCFHIAVCSLAYFSIRGTVLADGCCLFADLDIVLAIDRHQCAVHTQLHLQPLADSLYYSLS